MEGPWDSWLDAAEEPKALVPSKPAVLAVPAAVPPKETRKAPEEEGLQGFHCLKLGTCSGSIWIFSNQDFTWCLKLVTSFGSIGKFRFEHGDVRMRQLRNAQN